MYVVQVKEEKCTGCGECVTACPAQILEVADGKAQVVGDDCLGCESCVGLCPTEAITVNEY